MNETEELWPALESNAAQVHPSNHEPVLDEYEEIVVFHSAGKDSCAAVLHLFELGVDRRKILLHHHLVDGPNDDLMDWPVSESYVRAFANAFGLRISFSYREGGFRAEMLRENQPTRPSIIPLRDGTTMAVGGNGPLGTRRKFPQVSASLNVRWCSAYAKVSISDAWIGNDPAFADGRKRLVITGERAEESPGRAKYKTFERHRRDNRSARVNRWVDHWRPVHAWREQQVWDILKRWRVNPFASYHIGTGRASCRFCVFAGPNQWATMRHIDPAGFEQIAAYEREFGVTIHRQRSVVEQADLGQLLPGARSRWARIAMSKEYLEPIIVSDWVLPPGAFGENSGPR